jgi:phosphoglycolate phosphatase
MTFQGVLFDLDGTLADSIEDIADAMNRVLSGHGFPIHDYESYKYFVGSGLRNLVIESLPRADRGKELIERCLKEMIKDYQQNCLNKTRLYDGIRILLTRLQKKGLRMAVFSNKREDLTRHITKALVDSEFFDIVIGARPELPKKPDPSGAFLISEYLNLAPEKLLFLGDTRIDMLTANNAGMYAVGVTWGFREKEELIKGGAREIINHPGELLKIITASGV